MTGTEPAQASVVALGRGEIRFIWAAAVTLGAAAGWALPAVSGWIAGLPLAPFKPVFRAIDSLPTAVTGVVAPLVGAVAGAVIAYLIVADELAVTVADDEVTLARGDRRQTLPRDRIDAVFLDGKQLVLLDATGAELGREGCDRDGAALADAFHRHGYPWRAEDPYEADYRPWVEGTPELSPTANAVLRVRQEAVRKGRKGDAEALRADLARQGIVVRERDRRQYWRSTSEGQDEVAAD